MNDDDDDDSQCVRGRVLRRGTDSVRVSVCWNVSVDVPLNAFPSLFGPLCGVRPVSVLCASSFHRAWSVFPGYLGIWSLVSRSLCEAYALLNAVSFLFIAHPFIHHVFSMTNVSFFWSMTNVSFFPSSFNVSRLFVPILNFSYFHCSLLWLNIIWNLALVSILSVSHQLVEAELHPIPASRTFVFLTEYSRFLCL